MRTAAWAQILINKNNNFQIFLTLSNLIIIYLNNVEIHGTYLKWGKDEHWSSNQTLQK